MNRGAFANGGALAVLHPDFARAVWDERACAPKLVEGPALARLQRRLARRAEQLGATTTVDPGVRVLADGEVLMPVSVVDGLYRFAPPEGTRRLRLRSRAAIPAALPGLDSEDTRRLGVMATDLEVDGRGFALDGLGDGWEGSEADGPRRWRWTNGDAALPLGRALALRLHPLPAYPLIAAGSRRCESAARGEARA